MFMCVYARVRRHYCIKMSHVQYSVREEKKNVNERPTTIIILVITLTEKTLHIIISNL